MKRLLWALVVFSSLAAIAQQQTPRKPIVLIEGHGGITSSAFAIGPFASASAGRHDQTVELARHLLKRCPDITLTVARPVGASEPDYVLYMNHDGQSQIMLMRASDATVLFATTENRVKDAAISGCKAVLSDWKSPANVAASKLPPKQVPNAEGSVTAESERWYNVSKPAQQQK
jgi:hypothetical protein